MSTVLFAGGGTLGPVTPLLAVASRLREYHQGLDFAWAGTDEGPERQLITSAGIPFTTIPVAKLPRYFTYKLLTVPLDMYRARKQAGALLDATHPKLVMSAGGYTAVPVIQEAYRRRIPCIAHQLDYQTGLSNRMVAAHCRYVTTSFEYLQSPFRASVVSYHVPTPVRFKPSDVSSREVACRLFGLDPSRSVLLVTGGGTGALSLNAAIGQIRKRLPSGLQILHLTGKGKGLAVVSEPDYVVRDFLGPEMINAFAAADIVVSRAGIGAISELAALSKAAILVPLANSPQLANVRPLKGTVRVVQEREGMAEDLMYAIKALLDVPALRERMGHELHETFLTDDGTALANLALSVIK